MCATATLSPVRKSCRDLKCAANLSEFSGGIGVGKRRVERLQHQRANQRSLRARNAHASNQSTNRSEEKRLRTGANARRSGLRPAAARTPTYRRALFPLVFECVLGTIGLLLSSNLATTPPNLNMPQPIKRLLTRAKLKHAEYRSQHWFLRQQRPERFASRHIQSRKAENNDKQFHTKVTQSLRFETTIGTTVNFAFFFLLERQKQAFKPR